jgi:hypothetical protein
MSSSDYPFADPDDVADIWRPLTTDERVRVSNLIDKAAARLIQKCPFDLDARIALFQADSTDPAALDPLIVADVVATVVKRFLVNPDGFASASEAAGPFSRSGTYVNRYDKTGTDVRGSLQVTEADIEQLRPAVPATVASSFRVGIPRPKILIPQGGRVVGRIPIGFPPIIIPDVDPDAGAE